VNDAALRDELCRVGARLFARGHVVGSAGNLSARVDGGFLITPTDACLGTLDPAALAFVGDDGVQRSGAKASKTLALHRAIYAVAPDARCVIHSHSTQLVALSLQGVWSDDAVLPPITPYFVMKVGRVPQVPYHRPGDPAVAAWVAARITESAARGMSIRAVMLERLGPVVWHRDPAAACSALEELEETARLWLASGRQARPLDAAQIDELRTHFGAVW
jgi:3-dehydro-4-phosphotetronate decarboxylase